MVDPQGDELAEFGRRVLARRKELGFSQPVLGERVGDGVTRQTISNWENGRWGISEALMSELTEALKCAPEDLWPGWGAADRGHVGGKRDDRVPTPQRLDALEADLAALRAELAERKIIETGPTAAELNRHLERLAEQAEQQGAESGAASPSSRRRQQS